MKVHLYCDFPVCGQGLRQGQETGGRGQGRAATLKQPRTNPAAPQGQRHLVVPTRNRLTPGTETEAGASISQARLELGQGLSPERRALQLQMQSTSWQLQNSMHQTASSTTQGLKGPCPAPRRPQQRPSVPLPPALQNCNGERCVTQPVAGTPEPPLLLRKVTRLMTPFPHHFLLP